MAFEVASSCPKCGAPIWVSGEINITKNPPQHRFTCECRFESKKEESKDSNFNLRDLLQRGPNQPSIQPMINPVINDFPPFRPNPFPWNTQPIPQYIPPVTWTSDNTTGRPPFGSTTKIEDAIPNPFVTTCKDGLDSSYSIEPHS